MLSVRTLLVILGCYALWGWVTHICVSKLNITGSDNALSPGRCPAIIWTNAGILFIGPLGTKFSEILIEIYTFPFKKNVLENVVCEMASICLGLNMLILVVRTHIRQDYLIGTVVVMPLSSNQRSNSKVYSKWLTWINYDVSITKEGKANHWLYSVVIIGAAIYI